MPYFEDWQIAWVCNRLHLENTIFQMLEHSMWDIYSYNCKVIITLLCEKLFLHRCFSPTIYIYCITIFFS